MRVAVHAFLAGVFDPDQFHARTGLRLVEAQSLDASAITPDVYAAWRAPRRGAANPERMNNPLWEWLVRTGVDAWTATAKFGGPSPFDAGPGWSLARNIDEINERPALAEDLFEHRVRLRPPEVRDDLRPHAAH